MTGLVLRKVRSGGMGMVKLKWVPVVRGVISGGVVKLERVQGICPACGQQVEAVARTGQVKGYCAVAKQYVESLIETQGVRIGKRYTAETRAKLSAAQKKNWQDPEYRARLSATMKKRRQSPEYRARQRAARKKHWQDAE